MRALRRTSIAVAAAVALVAVPAVATAQLAPSTIGPQETVSYVSHSGVVDNYPGSPNYYVGPYAGTIGGVNVTIYCVDFLNSVSNGNTWTANIGTMSGGGMAATRIGLETGDHADALDRYSRATWLASQFAANTGRANWSGIHAAIWRIAVPGANATATHPFTGQGDHWYNQAMALDLGTWDASGWRVVTDVDATGFSGGRQEYLVQVTPEPATILLLGTGLGALLLVGYRRRET